MIARFSLSEGGMKFIPLILAQFENLGELVKRGQRIFLVGKLSFKRIA